MARSKKQKTPVQASLFNLEDCVIVDPRLSGVDEVDSVPGIVTDVQGTRVKVLWENRWVTWYHETELMEQTALPL